MRPKTANLTNFAIIEGLLYPAQWPIEAKFGRQQYTHCLCLQANFHLGRFIVLLLRGEKPPVLQFLFQIKHSVVTLP